MQLLNVCLLYRDEKGSEGKMKVSKEQYGIINRIMASPLC